MDQIKKKIEQFLMSTLVVTALVLLLVAEIRPAPPVQTAAPTHSATESTVQPQPLSPAMEQVMKALKKHPPAVSMPAYCVCDPTLLEATNTRGFGAEASAYALAQLCGERKMNPVDGIWSLVKGGLYDRNADTSGVLSSVPFFPPLQEQRTYDFTVDGVHELLTDALSLSAEMQDGLPMEELLLGKNRKLDNSSIFQSDDGCLCAYYVCYGDRSAHFLCFYFRGGEVITDVDFHLMNLHYASGDQDAVAGLDKLGDDQVVTMLTALELLMTGTSRASEGDIPFSYSLEDCGVSITRYALTGSGESGHLTCCRIKR